MSYKILLLKPTLYYVKWSQIPKANSPEMQRYFFEMNAILDSEAQPVYFLSDLRDGHITNAHLLLQLARVLDHKNYAGGASFSQNNNANRDLRILNYIKTANRNGNTKAPNKVFFTPQEALEYLEEMMPTITDGVDWDEILSGQIFHG